MNKYYECHITMLGPKGFLENLVITLPKWKYSCIWGNPILGNSDFSYATAHFSMNLTEEQVIGFMNATAAYLKDGGAEIVRQKVEVVIYDTRQKSESLQPPANQD